MGAELGPQNEGKSKQKRQNKLAAEDTGMDGGGLAKTTTQVDKAAFYTQALQALMHRAPPTDPRVTMDFTIAGAMNRALYGSMLSCWVTQGTIGLDIRVRGVVGLPPKALGRMYHVAWEVAGGRLRGSVPVQAAPLVRAQGTETAMPALERRQRGSITNRQQETREGLQQFSEEMYEAATKAKNREPDATEDGQRALQYI